MPWSVIARVVFAIVAYRYLKARRRGEAVVDVERLRGRIAAAREPVLIGARLITVVVLGLLTAALVTAGTTGLLLSPAWVGGVLIALAVVCAIATVHELIKLRRDVAARQRRLHTRELNQELEETRGK